MSRKTVSAIMMSLLVMGTLALVFNVQQVKASGTIYIRADGSIDPPTAPIYSADNITYTLTGKITADVDGIVIETDNIVVDGAGYTVTGGGNGNGITLTSRSNVTVGNMTIENFRVGIYLEHASANVTANNGNGTDLYSSSDNTLSDNNLANNLDGIVLDHSTNNTLSGNNVIANNYYGIYLYYSSDNTLSDNNLANNWLGIVLDYSSNNTLSDNNLANNYYGIYLYSSPDNTLSDNNVANNYEGIWLSSSSDNTLSGNNVTSSNLDGIWLDSSTNNTLSDNNLANNLDGIYLYYCSDNIFYHNNFVANTQQVNSASSANVWDNGYPSGGNYWSDYNDTDLYGGPFQNIPGNDGIGDTPCVIDAQNQDRYPLMNPWTPQEHDVAIISVSPFSRVRVVGLGYSVNVSVTAINQGEHAEDFNVTGYANTTLIASEAITLTSEDFTTLTFTWNTAGIAMGNYTISAYAWPVPGETDTTDNNRTWSVSVHVGVPGDVSSTVPGVYDGLVNMTDVAYTVALFDTGPNSPNWKANADVNNDGVCNMKDIAIAIYYFNQHE